MTSKKKGRAPQPGQIKQPLPPKKGSVDVIVQDNGPERIDE